MRRTSFEELLGDVERPEPKKRNYEASKPPSNVMTTKESLEWVGARDKKHKEAVKRKLEGNVNAKKGSVGQKKQPVAKPQATKGRGSRVKVQKGNEGWECKLCFVKYGEEEDFCEVELWVECCKCAAKLHVSCIKASKECFCEQKLIVVTK